MEAKYSGRNIFLSDLQSAVKLPFLIAVLGVVICFCLDNWQTLIVIPYSQSESLCVHYFFFNAYSFGGIFMDYFSCLLAALPFAARYSHELRGGRDLYALARCSRQSYARAKMLVAGLSGGLVMLLGGLIFILMLGSYLPIITPSRLLEYQNLPYHHALSVGEGLGYFAAVLYLAFLSGALCGCAGMGISAFLPDPYIAICSPMVLSFIFVEFGRLTGLPSGLRLELLLKARSMIYSECLTLVLVTVEVLTLCWIIYQMFLKRISQRLEEAGQ